MEIDETILREKMRELWKKRGDLICLLMTSVFVEIDDNKLRMGWRENCDEIASLVGPYIPITQQQKDDHSKSGYSIVNDNENQFTLSIIMKHEATYALKWYAAKKLGDTASVNKYEYYWGDNVSSLINFLVTMIGHEPIRESINNLIHVSKKEMVERIDSGKTEPFSNNIRESAYKVADAITDGIIKKWGSNEGSK